MCQRFLKFLTLPNLDLNELLLLKVSLFNSFSDFLKLKSDLTKICLFFILATYLGGGYTMQLRGNIPKEGRWNAGVGRSSAK
jgi:hypothetical protein